MKENREVRPRQRDHYTHDAVDAAYQALSTLGPKAHDALEPLRSMVARGLIAPGRAKSRDFHILLVRLGAPLDTIEKPANVSGTPESYRRYIARAAERER